HVALERLVLEHLLTLLGRGVEDHALAEDRRHEGVRLALVEGRVGCAEELLVRLGAGDQHDLPVGEVELPDRPALGVGALEQRDRVDPQLREMPGAVVGDGVGDDGNLVHPGQGIEGRLGVAHRSSTGASGLTSTRLRCSPRGADTTVVIAAARAAGLRKCWWRAWPNRTQPLMTVSTSSGVQSEPISLWVGPGRTMLARTPVPSSSICRAWTMPSRPHLP